MGEEVEKGCENSLAPSSRAHMPAGGMVTGHNQPSQWGREADAALEVHSERWPTFRFGDQTTPPWNLKEGPYTKSGKWGLPFPHSVQP